MLLCYFGIFTLVTLAFKGKSAESVRGTGGLNNRRAQVFDAYKKAMFNRPGRNMTTSYTQQQTEHWLSWLANSMKCHDQSVFYLELIQPDWLPSRMQMNILAIGILSIVILAFGMVFGLVGLIGFLLFSLYNNRTIDLDNLFFFWPLRWFLASSAG